MKRLLAALGMTLIFSISAIAVCFAAAPVGSDTIEEWDLKVPYYPNTMSILDGSDGCYYIYPEGERGIPYVMIYVYDGFSSEEEFFNNFTPFLATKYSDLEVVSDIMPITIDNDEYYEVDYNYTVGGAWCEDRRIARIVDGRTYMFASKEIPENNKLVGSLLEDTIFDCVFLAVEDDTEIPVSGDPESDIPEIWWSDIEDELEPEGIEGDFYYLDEIDAKIWIPDFAQSVPLSSADREEGYIAYFESLDDMSAMGVQYYEAGITESEYIEAMQYSDLAEDITQYYVNDIPFITYNIPDNDVFVLGTVTTSGAILEVSFYPASESPFDGLYEVMAASIQAS